MADREGWERERERGERGDEGGFDRARATVRWRAFVLTQEPEMETVRLNETSALIEL